MIEFFFLFMASFLIFYDAKKLQEYNGTIYLKEIKLSPMGLSIASLLIFIVFAPFYLIKRSRYFNAVKSDEETQKKIEEDVTFKVTADLTQILILYLISSTFLSIFFFILSYAVPGILYWNRLSYRLSAVSCSL